MNRFSAWMNARVQRVAAQRAQLLVPPLLPWLTAQDGLILDFGAGLGHVGWEIGERSGRPVEFVDVKRYPYLCPGVEMKLLINGKTIPFPDKHFATSLVIFVLHHSPNPRASLEEVIRVTQNDIVVCEDHLISRGELFSEAIKDLVANCFLPHVRFQYRTQAAWEAMFSSLGLKIRARLFFESRYIFNFKHIAWHLVLPVA